MQAWCGHCGRLVGLSNRFARPPAAAISSRSLINLTRSIDRVSARSSDFANDLETRKRREKTNSINFNSRDRMNRTIARSAKQIDETRARAQVTKEEYDTCRLSGSQAARTVAKCDQQQANRPFTVTFRSFSPQPGGLEFKSGQEYYFITALLGQPDPARRFSPCREQNMRVIFKVCCAPNSRQSSSSLMSLLPAPSPAQQQQQRSAPSIAPPTRRPLVSVSASPVITLKPSLVIPQQREQTKQVQQQLYQQQQDNQVQQLPFTVLPIEELHEPSSSESPEILVSTSAAATSEREPSPAAPNNNDQSLNNIQNDKPVSQPTGSPLEPFRLFDPKTSPEILKRYTPTPLPMRPASHHRAAPPAIDGGDSRREPWQQHPLQQQQQRIQQAGSRWPLYPHNQFNQQLVGQPMPQTRKYPSYPPQLHHPRGSTTPAASESRDFF